MTEGFPTGATVHKPGFARTGTVVRTERKFRTDWVVVSWEDSQYTAREYPRSLQLGRYPSKAGDPS